MRSAAGLLPHRASEDLPPDRGSVVHGDLHVVLLRDDVLPRTSLGPSPQESDAATLVRVPPRLAGPVQAAELVMRTMDRQGEAHRIVHELVATRHVPARPRLASGHARTVTAALPGTRLGKGQLGRGRTIIRCKRWDAIAIIRPVGGGSALLSSSSDDPTTSSSCNSTSRAPP